jgi:hypothetical protein
MVMQRSSCDECASRLSLVNQSQRAQRNPDPPAGICEICGLFLAEHMQELSADFADARHRQARGSSASTASFAVDSQSNAGNGILRT